MLSRQNDENWSSVGEMTRALYRRAKEAILTGWHIPVLGVLCVGLLDTDHNENVLEVRANATWGEGFAAFLLEDHGHNVIANVTLPQQLQIQKQNTNILSHTTHGEYQRNLALYLKQNRPGSYWIPTC